MISYVHLYKYLIYDMILTFNKKSNAHINFSYDIYMYYHNIRSMYINISYIIRTIRITLRTYII